MANPASGGPSDTPPPTSIYLRLWSLSVAPNDIATNPADGRVAIVDAGHRSIELLRAGGSHLRSLTKFKDPRSAAFLQDGTLLVSDAGNGSVRGYGDDGHVVLTLGTGGGEFLSPNDIAVHPDTGFIYVVDSDRNAVRVYRPDGSFAFQFGTHGTGPGELRFPLDVALDPVVNEVYVSDSRNRRIAVFNAASGLWKRNFGGVGSGDEGMSFPAGLYVDPVQRVYVTDSLGGFVQMFDPEGGFIGTIGNHGTGPGQLRSPKAVVIDRFNRLLVASYRDRKIEVWGLDGFEDPVDPDVDVAAQAIPDHLHRELPSFYVVLHLPGGETGNVDPGTVLINDTVSPELDVGRVPDIGGDVTVRFSTADVLAALPPGTSGSITLQVSGMTTEGLYFMSEMTVVIVPAG